MWLPGSLWSRGLEQRERLVIWVAGDGSSLNRSMESRDFLESNVPALRSKGRETGTWPSKVPPGIVFSPALRAAACQGLARRPGDVASPLWTSASMPIK